MQMEFLLNGSIIGLLFGIPIGAVGAITVQRTLNYGIKAGLFYLKVYSLFVEYLLEPISGG